MKTTVISIRFAPKGWETDPRFQYIGRAGKGHTGEWGNPFTVQQYGQGGACLAHRQWLEGTAHQEVEPARRKWILDNMHLLTGKYLVCFCKDRQGQGSCHGDFYAEMTNA